MNLPAPSRRSALLGGAALLAGCATPKPAAQSGPIDEGVFVDALGGKQWLRIRGEDRANPALLYVHGGPGAATSVWAWPYFRAMGWEKFFTLIHWDQPGAGHTFAAAGKTIPAHVSMESIAADGLAIAREAARRLGQRKLVLMGGSWGSAIGLMMAHAQPSLFHAYVGTAQVVNKREGDQVAWAQVVAKARLRKDDAALAQLLAAGPPPYASAAPLRVFQKFANAWEVAGNGPAREAVFAQSGATSDDLNLWLAGIEASEAHFLGPKIDGPWTAFDARTLGRRFALPMFFFQGEDDDIAPAPLVEDYAAWIEAPQKAYVPIRHGGHNIDIRDGRVLAHLVARVRPLTA